MRKGLGRADLGPRTAARAFLARLKGRGLRSEVRGLRSGSEVRGLRSRERPIYRQIRFMAVLWLLKVTCRVLMSPSVNAAEMVLERSTDSSADSARRRIT
jgi:hypothetical protein